MIVDFFLFMRNKRKAKTNKNQNRMLGRTWEKDSENALAKKKKKKKTGTLVHTFLDTEKEGKRWQPRSDTGKSGNAGTQQTLGQRLIRLGRTETRCTPRLCTDERDCLISVLNYYPFSI
jgi:hypothetical protein